MSKRIEIRLKEEAGQLIQRAKKAAAKHGATLEGDDARGEFNATGIHGTYEIEGDLLAITITKKPLILPWALIEKTVTDFFA